MSEPDAPRAAAADEAARDDAAMAQLLALANGAALTQAMAVAAQLGLSDRLWQQPRQAATLAGELDCDPAALRRLLRALTSAGLYTEHEDGSFSVTPIGALLRTDAPRSLRHWAINWGTGLWPEWAHLMHSVRTGESARKWLRNASGLDHLQHDAVAAATFSRAMVEQTRSVAQRLAHHHDFSQCKSIADVGGGYGELLGAVLAKHHHLTGLLCDQPHALAGARSHLQAGGVLERCRIVETDFFVAVPAGADLYMLKSVLHDWDDARCRLILNHCREAAGHAGRLLIVEQIMPERMLACSAHQDLARRDLTMLIGPGGKERTLAGFASLLASGGWAMGTVGEVASGFFAIEAAIGPWCDADNGISL